MVSGFGILSQAINRADAAVSLDGVGVRGTHSPRVRIPWAVGTVPFSQYCSLHGGAHRKWNRYTEKGG